MTKRQLKTKLLNRAKFAAKILSFVPFIRMIAVNGSLASGKINQNSDIDFFIICEKGHLWTARFFTIGILAILLLRAKGKNHDCRICLNHFLSNQDYILGIKNCYNYNQYGQLKLLYNQINSYQNFIYANGWMKRFGKIKTYYINNKQSFIQKVFEYVFKDSEHKFKEKQLKKINQNPFYKQRDSVKSFTDREFYFYTDVSSKWKYNLKLKTQNHNPKTDS